MCSPCIAGIKSPKTSRLSDQLGRTCVQCHKTSPEVYFNVRKGRINVRCTHCNEASAAYKKRNWDKTLQARRVWLETANGAKYKKESGKKKWRINKYGISNEMFESLRASQNNACAICKLEVKELCVDHDHETGMVRALLCRKCNTGLGHFKDNVTTIENAIKYLEHFENWSHHEK